MDNIENKEVQENEDIEQNLSAEELAEREQLFNDAIDKIKGMGLNWTWRSIEYVVNKEGLTFN